MTIAKIYAQHKSAFRDVAAYVIMLNYRCVATIAFKYPEDGAGKLYVYVHCIGFEMVRGQAVGYDYDERTERTAAIEDAFKRIKPSVNAFPGEQWAELHAQDMEDQRKTFQACMVDIGDKVWSDALMDAGYTVITAI